MLVNKSVLNEIKKESRSLKVSRTEGRSTGQHIQKLDDLQNLLIKLTVKTSTEKAWLLHELPFSLNPGNKLNDAQT